MWGFFKWYARRELFVAQVMIDNTYAFLKDAFVIVRRPPDLID
jgi:hypothetical protein